MNRVAIKPMLIKIIATFTSKLTASILLVLLTCFSTSIQGLRAIAQADVAPEPGYSVTLMNDTLIGPVEIDVVPGTPGVPGVPGGTLYVSNEGPPGVFANQDFISKLNSDGTTSALKFIDGLEGASGLAVDSAGNIYVSQDAARPLRKYDSQGGFVFEFVPHRPEFADPNTLALTGDGLRLLVPGQSSNGNWRILAFDTNTGQRLNDFIPEFSFTFVNSIFFKDGLLYIAGTPPETGMSPLLVAAEGQIPSPLPYNYPQHSLNGFTIGNSGQMYGTTTTELLKINLDGSVNRLATGFEFARGLRERKTNGCVQVADYRSGYNGALYQICQGGSISGTIYDTQSPAPSRLPNVGVDLLPVDGQGGLGFCSDATGNFTLSKIPAGNYIVSAGGWACGNDPSMAIYARTLYSVNPDGSFRGTNDPSQAKIFSLTLGTEAFDEINFSLVEGATVSGRLTAPGGAVLANVPVNVNGSGWGAGGCTDANGYYTIKGIFPGDYRISAGGANCGGGTGPVYAQVYYAGANSTTLDWNSAMVFPLAAGQPQPNITFSNLALAAIITGQVTNASTTGVANVDVGYCDSNGYCISWTRTDSSGNYTLPAAAGTWKIMFNPWAAGGNYLQQWYNNKSSSSNADLVSVTAGGTTGGINARLQSGAGIFGKVTNSSGIGIFNVDVWAEDLNGNWIGGTRTDSQGNYTFSVAPGTYAVGFNPTQANQAGGYYLSEWYDNRSNRNNRDFITVVSGNTTINAQLEMGGAISGTVTDSLNNIIANVDVAYCGLNGVCINSTRTDSYGNYRLTAPAGTWKIMFNPWAAGGNYLQQWYNNKNSPNNADSVSVTAGVTMSGISAQLGIGVTISGKVTDANGVAMANVQVGVNNSNNGYGACTDSTGSYTIMGITPGTDYQISAGGSRCNNGPLYAQVYYVGTNSTSPNWNDATRFTLVSGQTLSGINFSGLVLGATVSGRVTNPSGVALANVQVNVNGPGWGRGACTNTDGSYTISGIYPGTYRVSAGGNTNCPGGVYYGQAFYNNKTDWNSADLVIMNSGQLLSDVNFSGLVQAAGISGNLQGDPGIGVKNINVVLHDSQGRLVNSITTGQNGSYFFGSLAPGNYTIKVYDTFLNYRYAESGPLQVSLGTLINPNITLTSLTPSGTNLPSFKSDPQVYVYRTPGNPSDQEFVNLTAEIADPSGYQPPSIKSVTVVDPAGQLHYLYHEKYQALIDQGTSYAEFWQNTRDNALSNFTTLIGNYTFTILDMEGNRVSRTVNLGSYSPYKLPIPTLSSPANGSQVDLSTLTLSWHPVSGAVRYQVRIFENGERIFKGQNQGSTSFNVPATVPAGLLSSGRWYSWQVIAMDNAISANVDYRSNSTTWDFYTTGGSIPSPQPLNVNIVPWVSGSPLIPHDAYAGHKTTLKAMVKGGTPPYTYTWDFGDGTPQYTPAATSGRNLGAKHQYTASSSNIFNAKITVTDTTGTIVSAIYPVKFWADPSRGVKVNVAIDDALWWLHTQLVFYTSNGIDYGFLSRGNYPAGTTAMALQAWVLNGHKPDGDPNNPYTDDVLRAKNYVLSQIFPVCIAPETIAGITRNPDSNIAGGTTGNGQGLYVKNGHRLYETGLVLMALSTLKDPTLMETIKDLVDYLAYAQVEPDAGGGRGGWRYDTNYRESDMSVTQFPLLGLEAAEYHMSSMGVTIPLYVKEELKNNFLYFVQNKEQGGSNFGGFGYSSPNSWVNVAKTGAGLVGMALTGFPFSDTRVASALQFINEHWYQAVEDPTGNNQAYNIGDLYAMYAVMKGMKSFEMRGANTTHIGGHDWYDEYAQWEIQNQYDNGTWQSPVNSYGPYVDTAFGVLLLLPQVFAIGPTAMAQASPTQLEVWQSVTFSHSGSFHMDKSKSIVSYAWDFNGDGSVDWTTTSLTETRTYRYPAPGTYTAILKVTDNTGLVGTDQVTIVVSKSTLAPMTIKIEPATLNLGSNGVFTASITLPGNSNYALSDIDTSSLICEGAPVVDTNLAAKKLIAKFNRVDLKGVPAGEKVTLTVTGTFKDGRPFKGSDTVKVLSK
jgi:protocatechuate 3,4-dioxygenase beta subunit